MATYTLTASDADDALFTYLVGVYNREQDLTLTNTQYLNVWFPRLLAPYAAAYQAQIAAQFQTLFANASPDVQNAVMALLDPPDPP